MAEEKQEEKEQVEELTEKKEAPKLKVEVVEESPSETQEIKEEIKEEKSSEDVKAETVEEKEEEKVEDKQSTQEGKFQEEETEEKTGSTKRLVVIALLVAGVVSLVVGGILRFRSSVENVTPASPTPISTPQPSPTPSSEEELVLSEFSIQVLNGSGVIGRAGEVATALEEAGFEGIETGNAETYDFTDTEVQVKTGTPQEVFDAIEEALTDYNVVEGDELDEDSEFDAIVIVGEKD